MSSQQLHNKSLLQSHTDAWRLLKLFVQWQQMLIETGFITNANEERRLSDPVHRERLASAVVAGIRDYFSDQAPPGTWFAARQEQNGEIRRDRQYVVSRGETLSQIATRHGVPLDTILLANNKRSDDVRVGERLIIPAAAAPR